MSERNDNYIDPTLQMLYGLGQQRAPVGDDPDIAKDLNFIQDLLYSLDVDLGGLLNQTPAPEKPEYEELVAPVQPDYFQSDLIRAYANNEFLGPYMSSIAQGTDPQLVFQDVVNRIQQDPELESFLPQSYVGPYNERLGAGEGETSLAGLQQLFQDAAVEAARERRERAVAEREYGSAMQNYEAEVARRDAERQAYEQYYSPQSELAARGNPSLDQDIDMYLEALGYSRPTLSRPDSQGLPDRRRDAAVQARERRERTSGGFVDDMAQLRDTSPAAYQAAIGTSQAQDLFRSELERRVAAAEQQRADRGFKLPYQMRAPLQEGQLHADAYDHLLDRVTQQREAQSRNMLPAPVQRQRADQMAALQALLGRA